jgi:hypothetical protein
VNGPLLAAIFVTAAVIFVGWLAVVGHKDPPLWVVRTSFAVWAVPLYYLGAWASNVDFGIATTVMVAIAAVWYLQSLRYLISDKQMQRMEPQGPEEVFENQDRH